MSEIPVNKSEATTEGSEATTEGSEATTEGSEATTEGGEVFAEVLGASTVKSTMGMNYFPVEGNPFKPVRKVDHPGLLGLNEDKPKHRDFIDRVPSFEDKTGEDES